VRWACVNGSSLFHVLDLPEQTKLCHNSNISMPVISSMPLSIHLFDNLSIETCEIVHLPFSQHVNVNVKSRTLPAVAEPETHGGKLGKQPHLQCELDPSVKEALILTSPTTPTNPLHTTHLPKMAVKPITGMLRRGLVLDLSVAFGMPFARARPRTPPEDDWSASEEDGRRAGQASKQGKLLEQGA
jgi:hypothetical protein